MATVIERPLADYQGQRTFFVASANETNAHRSFDGMRLLTLVPSEQGKPAPQPEDGRFVELVILAKP